MTTQALLQVLASGLLMGLIYALIAVGLSLIFGLMDVVNFAHGEFLMTAMYVVFGLFLFTAIDPVLLTPVAAPTMKRTARASISGWCASPCGPRPIRAWSRSSPPSAWRR